MEAQTAELSSQGQSTELSLTVRQSCISGNLLSLNTECWQTSQAGPHVGGGGRARERSLLSSVGLPPLPTATKCHGPDSQVGSGESEAKSWTILPLASICNCTTTPRPTVLQSLWRHKSWWRPSPSLVYVQVQISSWHTYEETNRYHLVRTYITHTCTHALRLSTPSVSYIQA